MQTETVPNNLKSKQAVLQPPTLMLIVLSFPEISALKSRTSSIPVENKGVLNAILKLYTTSSVFLLWQTSMF